MAIHPSQIKLANKVFSPPEAEVNKAKRILEELEKAAKEGKGAAQLDGRMIDAASANTENIVNIDKLITVNNYGYSRVSQKKFYLVLELQFLEAE